MGVLERIQSLDVFASRRFDALVNSEIQDFVHEGNWPATGERVVMTHRYKHTRRGPKFSAWVPGTVERHPDGVNVVRLDDGRNIIDHLHSGAVIRRLPFRVDPLGPGQLGLLSTRAKTAVIDSLASRARGKRHLALVEPVSEPALTIKQAAIEVRNDWYQVDGETLSDQLDALEPALTSLWDALDDKRGDGEVPTDLFEVADDLTREWTELDLESRLKGVMRLCREVDAMERDELSAVRIGDWLPNEEVDSGIEESGDEVDVKAAWYECVGIYYSEVVMEYGNDGHPDDDRHLSEEQKARRSLLAHQISQETEVPVAVVKSKASQAARRFGDSDAGEFEGPPDWALLAEAEQRQVVLDSAAGTEFDLTGELQDDYERRKKDQGWGL